MVDKIQYALTLFESNEILILLAGLIVYHVVILGGITLSVRSSLALRLKSLHAELDETRKNWEHRDDEGWKDREEELRRILNAQQGREVSQIKAEYDSYIGLLEQKLASTRTREKNIPHSET